MRDSVLEAVGQARVGPLPWLQAQVLALGGREGRHLQPLAGSVQGVRHHLGCEAGKSASHTAHSGSLRGIGQHPLPPCKPPPHGFVAREEHRIGGQDRGQGGGHAVEQACHAVLLHLGGKNTQQAGAGACIGHRACAQEVQGVRHSGGCEPSCRASSTEQDTVSCTHRRLWEGLLQSTVDGELNR